MPSFSVPRLLGLPQTFNGHALAYLLILSFVCVTVQIGLTAPSFATWQGFILFSLGPPLVIYHIAVFWYLYKGQTKASNIAYVPECLIRKLNIGFLAVFHLVWIAGTACGFVILPLVLDGPWDGGRHKALAWASAAFGLTECLLLGLIAMFCIRARKEKLASHDDVLIHEQHGNSCA